MSVYQGLFMSDAPNGSAPVTSSSAGAAAANQASQASHAAAGASSAQQAAYSGGSGNMGTMAALKEQYPKVYKYIMLSIAQNMCIEMQHRNQQLTQKMKKMSQNNP